MKKSMVWVWMVLASSLAAQNPQLILPKGHAGFITSVAFSPACADDPAGGRFLLTGSSDNTAKLWDRTGHEIRTFSGHDFLVDAVAFAPDGRTVLTGSFDGTARIWDLSGRQVHVFQSHRNYVTAAVFSPDGRYVLTGSKDGTAVLWDAAAGDSLRSYRSQEPIASVAFSPNGKYFLTAQENGSVFLWEVESGKRKDAYSNPEGGKANVVAFMPDGRSFAVAYAVGGAAIWSLSANKPAAILTHGAEVTALAVSPDGQYVATGDVSGQIHRWNSKAEQVATFQGHPLEIRSLAYSPAGAFDPTGGALLLSGGADKTARLWDQGNQMVRILKGHTNPVVAQVFSKTKDHHAEQFLTTALASGGLQRWNLSSNEMQSRQVFTPDVSCVAVASNGQLTFIGDEEGNLYCRDDKGNTGRTYNASSRLKAVAGTMDGQVVVGGTDQNTIFVWDSTGDLVQNFTILRDISALGISENREFIATGSQDGAVRIWDSTGHIVFEKLPQFGEKEVGALAFSPVSPPGEVPLLLFGDANGRVMLWDSERDKVIAEMTVANGAVNAVGFSADGSLFASGHADGVVKLWERATGKEIASLVGLDADEWVVISPSGLFDASPNAMNLMYYVQDLRVIELEQLKRYWEPGLLSQIIRNKPLRNVSEFGALALPPDIQAGIENDQLKVRLREPAQGETLGRLSLLINGKEVAGEINPDKKTEFSIDLSRYLDFLLDSNMLTLRAFAAGDQGVRGQDYQLSYLLSPSAKGEGVSDEPAAGRGASGFPHLYAIVIGTSRYNNPKMKLRFPDKDAEVMAKALQAAGNSLFPNRVHVQVLSTADNRTLSDKDHIRAAFESVVKQSKAQDILVVYFSGHGLTFGPVDNSQFYYLTKDIRDAEALADDAQRNSYAVSSAEITTWLKAAKAQKQVLIFDACNSGSFANAFEPNSAKDLSPSDIRAYDDMKDVTGTYILAGAAADKVSFEASLYGQGLLTYSLLEGMGGLALLPDRRVDIMRLFQYADKRVEELARDIDKVQKPMLAFPKGSSGSAGETFAIGKVDAEAQANMPTVNSAKKVFIKSRFVNSDPGGEELDLDQAMDDYLANEIALSADAPYVFIPVDKYAPAYKISGNYAIQGDQVAVKAAIRKGDFVKTFSATGSKNALQKLAENLYNEMAPLIPQE